MCAFLVYEGGREREGEIGSLCGYFMPSVVGEEASPAVPLGLTLSGWKQTH